jgi:hypothetical protein
MPAAPYSVTEERTAVREGIVTGMIGAAVVALFFLGVDLIRGVPGLTPSVLGEVFVLRRPSGVTTSVDMTAAALYTAVHFVAIAAAASRFAVSTLHIGNSPRVVSSATARTPWKKMMNARNTGNTA